MINISFLPYFFSSSTNFGTNDLCPPARVDIPTIWTSFSTACFATSSGVWKSGPISTSNPMSAKPVATIFAPLSWPSCPIFATNILGRLPSSFANLLASFTALLNTILI